MYRLTCVLAVTGVQQTSVRALSKNFSTVPAMPSEASSRSGARTSVMPPPYVVDREVHGCLHRLRELPHAILLQGHDRDNFSGPYFIPRTRGPTMSTDTGDSERRTMAGP